MKNILRLSLSLCCMVLFFACRKSDNPKIPELERVPIPLITVNANAPVFIQDPAAFKSSFTVDLYFKNDAKPQKMDVVVARNGDYSNLKVFKADVNTYPTSFEITGQQLADLFGINISDIVPGDTYEISANVTLQNGKVIPAFSPYANAYGSNITNLPGSNVIVTFTAICAVNLNSLVGTATVTDNDFWGAVYPVTITLEGEDVLKIDGWVQQPGAIFRIKIDKDAQTATVEKQVYYPTLPTTPYHNPFVEGTGTIDACSNTITLSLDEGVDEGDFGASTVTISK